MINALGSAFTKEPLSPWGSPFMVTASGDPVIRARTLSGNFTYIENKGEFIDQGAYGMVNHANQYVSQTLSHPIATVCKKSLSGKSLRREADFAEKLYQKGLRNSPYISCPSAIIDQDPQNPSLVIPKNIITLLEIEEIPYQSQLNKKSKIMDECGYENNIILHDVYQGTKLLLENNLFHNDIRNDNIMLGQDGYFKHIDFGIATENTGTDIGLKDCIINNSDENKQEDLAYKILRTCFLDDYCGDHPITLLENLAEKIGNYSFKNKCVDIREKELNLTTLRALKFLKGQNISDMSPQAKAMYDTYNGNDDALSEKINAVAADIKESFLKLENEFPLLKIPPSTEQRHLLASHWQKQCETDVSSDSESELSHDALKESYQGIKRKRDSGT